MLKRSKTDNEIDSENAGAGDVLVLNEDAGAGELVARLLEHAGMQAVRSTRLTGVTTELEQGMYSGVIVDSLSSAGITAALRVLDDVRAAKPPVRDTAVIILAAGDTNRLFAFQSGVDAYLVRPFHAEELLTEVRAVLGRSVDERNEFRRSQLMGGATTG